ncbi:unnamed protein product [Closterium sp. NIES-64]|nr:unnamed protein product [Closterium sp. NIES-64]CAI5941347.1 unnamed protein product [Closterium sp. NIES-65]CAI5989089.1 unnamed protein product [Closterium sp. NIES-64]
MSFMRGDLLQKARLLMRGGVVDPPKWLDALSKVPPQPKARRCPKARRIEFPEDPLVESYYARHPEAKLQAYRLQGFDPPVARRFAWRQLELMQQQGLTKRQARDAVEAEFTRAEQEEEERAVQEWRRAIREGRQPAAVRCSAVEEVQQEERAHMLAGLEAMGAQLEAAAAEAEAEARAAQRSVGR